MGRLASLSTVSNLFNLLIAYYCILIIDNNSVCRRNSYHSFCVHFAYIILLSQPSCETNIISIQLREEKLREVK